jgi:hypothetical protein
MTNLNSDAGGRLRRLMAIAGCVTLGALASACATTTEAGEAKTVDPAAAARAAEQTEWKSAKSAVLGVLDALNRRDEVAFKASLSEARRAAYSRDYYELWVRETSAGRGHRAEGFEKGHSKQTARVIIAFRAGNNTERVPVRLVKEDGSWRWDEQ